MLKIDISCDDPATMAREVFGKDALVPGDAIALSDGVELINMSGGANNISAQDFVTLAVEYKSQLGSFIVGGLVYDALKAGVKAIYVNGRKIVTKEDLAEEIEKAAE